MRQALAACLVAVSAAVSTNATALEVPSPLVTTEWLAKNQDSVRVLDVRNDATSYKEGGHIIGAVRVDFARLRGTAKEEDVSIENISVRGDAFQTLMREAGVSENQPVVLTHRSKNIDDVGYATYLYWQLKLHGHDNVALLDGGTTKWIAENREVWGEDEDVEPGSFRATPLREELISNTKAVEDVLAQKSGELLDARPFEFFVGLEKRPTVQKVGHIPGAMLFPFTAALSPDGAFREKDALAKAVKAAGLSLAQPVTAYCNTGHTASIMWFVLHELVGYKPVSLYDGSMVAWTRHGNDVQTSASR